MAVMTKRSDRAPTAVMDPSDSDGRPRYHATLPTVVQLAARQSGGMVAAAGAARRSGGLRTLRTLRRLRGLLAGAAALLLAAAALDPVHVLAVAGGLPVREREYPYVAAFVRRTGTCTAIILTEHWLLTAAHCFTLRSRSQDNPYLSDVYAGLVDVSRGAAQGCGPGCQHRESRVAHIHPHFRARVSSSLYDDARHNNLALVHVNKALWLDTAWVRAAVRASAPSTTRRVRCAVCNCKLVGFGMGGVGPHAWAPGRLLKAERVPILPSRLCPPSRSPRMPRATLCSDSKAGVAPCLGDAGAPVVCDGHVVGMALGVYESRWEYSEHSFYCGFFKSCSLFGLYASLEPYASWIDSVVFRPSGVVMPLEANLSLIEDPDATC
ncbi:Kallikrein 1-related peptidase b9 [Frankliniella fusca]|uniref:Kallikrein 1-related peptidase b9 n=1 Tax=Frankliniella fusca TaxID=407009 RepID=A0AAE1LA28_9NEOP|nr:Kallikrein 1-related peptidase b9 [Frankliniella fusca]